MALRIQLPRDCKLTTDPRRYDGCSTCGEVVRKRQQRLTCRECGLLCHRTCSVMTQEHFRRFKREGALDGYRCAACTPDEEAQPIRVREQDVVEPVVPQAAPEEAIIPEPVREEPVVPVPPASSSVIGRVAGGMLSATGYMMALRILLPRDCKVTADPRRFDGCSTCGEVVRKRQQRLTCRECGLLCHRTCSVMTQEDFRRLKREGALDGYRCAACTPDEEAQPIRVREPDVVEPVVPQAAPEEAIIPEPVREEPVVPVPPASSSVIGRVAGGMLSATGYMV